MKNEFKELQSSNPKELRGLVYHFLRLERKLFLRSDILLEFRRYCESAEGSCLCKTGAPIVVGSIQEAAVTGSSIYLALRPGIARWEYYRLDSEPMTVEQISTRDFLRAKESFVQGQRSDQESVLEIDLRPFQKASPKMERPRSIGRGVQFLNRHLAGRLLVRNGRGAELLFHFLHEHHHRGRQLMLNAAISDADGLKEALREAIRFLEEKPADTPLAELQHTLVGLGFEPGWGRDAGSIAEMMNLLSELFEAPDATLLEDFLSRIPMIFRLAILSPHGFFGQSHVLGKPDTGGQVVYILDQVRALEKELRDSLREQGLDDVEPKIVVITRLIPEAGDTTCDMPVERIHGTRSAEIIRLPFRHGNGEVVPHWISRFKVWPYLERFAREVRPEILGRLGGRPDFIVGNYSDGNLVASMLAHSLGVTQCNIAHALEKTKYLYSDLYWREHEEEHRFSCQITADLIAMNTADFIITSTYQEIAGTPETLGQYESYRTFSLPGLYRVRSGIDPFDPKFNIVSPGADPTVFRPYDAESTTPAEMADDVADLIHGGDRPDALGGFDDKEKPMLFAMSRLDHIKNMSGLLDWYGGSPELQEKANLLLVGGHFRAEDSGDEEERGQIRLMHDLIARHGLQGKVRWVVMQTDKMKVGEFYRYVARHRGAFVQPARFEAFGLTVIEAMTSGLPVFATRYGGPLEIIEDGVSGFHIDPNDGPAAAAVMAEFFEVCDRDPDRWTGISRAAMQRVEEHYTWKRYARRMLSLSRIYGFWKYMTNIEHAETRAYISMFYHLMYKPLAERVPE
ncbi:sucrose synthase [Haloferula sargassicola]|uniref:Sucrose synthase n=1 Tax=Haloferula sargassicola TaxID=490096 RepID=A0ABP9ULA6_9BACT